MNILIINGSPKRKGGASAFFAKVLRTMLFPHKVTYKAPGVSRNYESIFAELQNMDIVVLSVPLYVDGIPSHFIRFLQSLEQYNAGNSCHFMLYVISNSGFVGGGHNKPHLEQYRCWCERANITWGGGLGIGGGVMLHVIFYLILLWGIIQLGVGILINIFSGQPAVNDAMLFNFAQSMITWLFFNSGMILYEWMLARAIKRKKRTKIHYTRVMIPSFILLIFADLFMTFSALFHGKWVFSLFKKVEK